MRLATKYKTIFYHPRDADANRYFGYITTPLSTRRKWIISEMVKQLKSDGNWLLSDRLWLFAHENEQAGLISLVNPSSTAITTVNSPVWVANQGYTSNGTTSYLNTNFNPATQGVNYVRNSSSIHIYSRTNIAETKYDMGSENSVNSVRAYIFIRNASDQFFGTINSVGFTAIASTDSSGFFSASRTSSNLVTSYRNGSSIGTSSDVSSAVESLNGYILALNYSDSPTAYSTKQIALAAYGSGDVNHTNFKNVVEKYMDAIGSGVIS